MEAILKTIRKKKIPANPAVVISNKPDAKGLRITKNLGVNETIIIDLEKELPSGTYTVSLPTGFNTAEPTPLTIENGKQIVALSWPYAIVAALFVVALAYLVYGRIRTKKKGKEKCFRSCAD